MEQALTLAPRVALEWDVVVKAKSPANARFRAEITSDQFEKPISEYEANQQY